ncbi:DUF2913 family protein [Vibrio cholerae]|uniref:DUF2913 family protein n=1 Tax=Vibrio cholerae TaxID=666 RepID=UPI0011D48BE0|nr:DUF2913 family protein [Vibrio cholerae]TXY52027.1 DUF2913 family protein [Vibrio cholerae]GIB32006.1 hypothetical protein VCSRO91_2887 [Vibrio cholerae]
MKSKAYHNQIKCVFQNMLLHLYMRVVQIKQTQRVKHVPVSVRNKIIIDFTKPKLKDKRYAEIRKNLKTIVLMKDKFGSIEDHLVSILEQYNQVKKRTDCDYLYSLLEAFESNGLNTMLIEESPEQELSNVVFIDREHVDNGFDENNQQVAPISLFIHTADPEPLVDCMEKHGHFQYELVDVSLEHGNYHYRLHPSYIAL